MTKTKMNTLLATTAFLALAACGGSGDGTAANPTQPPPMLTEQEQQNRLLCGDTAGLGCYRIKYGGSVIDGVYYGFGQAPERDTTQPQQADEFFGSVPTSLEYTALAVAGVRMIDDIINSDYTSPANLPTGSVQYNGVAAFRDDTNDFNLVASNPQLLATTQLFADFSQNTITGVFKNGVDAFGNTTTGSVDIINGRIVDNTFTAELNGSGSFLGKSGSVTGEASAAFVGNSGSSVFGVMTGNAAGDTFAGTFIAER